MSPISALFTRHSFSKPISRVHPKFFSTISSPIEYSLSQPIYTIWASNTGLGKTLISAGLAISFLSPHSPHFLSSTTPSKFIYLKPVQTGFPIESDSRFVYRKFSQLFLRNPPQFSVLASNHVLQTSIPASEAVLGSGFGMASENSDNSGAGSLRFGLDNEKVGKLGRGFMEFGLESEKVGKFKNGFHNLGWFEERKLHAEGGDGVVKELICKTTYGWKQALSPHLAAEKEAAVVGDSELLGMLKNCLGIGLESGVEQVQGEEVGVLTVIETAGGVASPGPSGTLQCDLYRPFRLPAVLVGDGRLGGISGTISAYESLKLRGYDVVAVVLQDHGLANEMPLFSYLQNRVPVLVFPPVPQDMSDNLVQWFEDSRSVFNFLKEIMLSTFLERMQRLLDMPKKARDILWWPFTQHKLVPEENVTVIDSRCGENFAVHKVQNYGLISQQFDACASWWTQGPDATLQIELARDMGYAAARFGHVMFPENVYEPALECAELLLDGVGKGWASRTFFSDNGSTAIEIALKMAFRKFVFDHGIVWDHLKSNTAQSCIEFKVLALRGSYHGDTLGAMEAQAPSSYTGFFQHP
ncbi:unnamed protein product, partial [Ilex paraguariensis]